MGVLEKSRLCSRKIIGRDAERRSRIHSRRGQAMPPGETLRIPGLLLERIHPTFAEPWMAAGAVSYLDAYLTPTKSVIELGSGSSTGWYGKRAGHVLSIEPDPAWAAKVRALVVNPGVKVQEGSIATVLASLDPLERFDVAVVDHIDEPGMTRVDAIRILAARVGAVVLDDSDRKEYDGVEDLMPGWETHRYVGLRSKPFALTETTIFLRR
jgi:hypothetical protein